MQQIRQSGDIFIQHTLAHQPSLIYSLFQPKTDQKRKLAKTPPHPVKIYSNFYQQEKQLFKQSRNGPLVKAIEAECERDGTFFRFKKNRCKGFLQGELSDSQIQRRVDKRLKQLKICWNPQVQGLELDSPQKRTKASIIETSERKRINTSYYTHKGSEDIDILQSSAADLHKQLGQINTLRKGLKHKLQFMRRVQKQCHLSEQQFYEKGCPSEMISNVLQAIKPDDHWLRQKRTTSDYDQLKYERELKSKHLRRFNRRVITQSAAYQKETACKPNAPKVVNSKMQVKCLIQRRSQLQRLLLKGSAVVKRVSKLLPRNISRREQ